MPTFVMHYATVSNHFLDWFSCSFSSEFLCTEIKFCSVVEPLRAFASSLLHLLHFRPSQLIFVVHGDVAVGHRCLSESSLISIFTVKEFILKGFPFNWSYSKSIICWKWLNFDFPSVCKIIKDARLCLSLSLCFGTLKKDSHVSYTKCIFMTDVPLRQLG